MNHHKIGIAGVIAVVIVFLTAIGVGYYKTSRDNTMNNGSGNLMDDSMETGDIDIPEAAVDEQETIDASQADENQSSTETNAANSASDAPKGDKASSNGDTKGEPTPSKGAEAPLTKADLEGIPEEFQPSESTALEAALVGAEDWVGKVTTHSNDWATATVLIGPPQSEYVQELHLKWNREGGYYDVVRTKGVQ